jgi:hypothetical protein
MNMKPIAPITLSIVAALATGMAAPALAKGKAGAPHKGGPSQDSAVMGKGYQWQCRVVNNPSRLGGGRSIIRTKTVCRLVKLPKRH